MGKLQPELINQIESEHVRVLTALELGHRNHQLVPLQIVSVISKLPKGGCHRHVEDLIRHKLVAYQTSHKGCGYRLTLLGYDTLALNALIQRGSIKSVGRTIGCGKESYVYEAFTHEDKRVVLKVHRLGQVCFRSLKRNRDYLSKRHASSWLYLSRLSALKEFAHQKVLHDNKFPVPAVITNNRNAIVMEMIDGVLLNDVGFLTLDQIRTLISRLLEIVRQFAENGLIHCDFNEFNVLLSGDLEPYIIDFPQMVSTKHPDAVFYFDRDVRGISEFFRRKFMFELAEEEIPKLGEIEQVFELDKALKASGYNDYIRRDCCLLEKVVSDEGDEDSDDGSEEFEEGSQSENVEISDETENTTSDSEEGTVTSQRRKKVDWTVQMARRKLMHEQRITNRQRLNRTIRQVKKECFRGTCRSNWKRQGRAEIIECTKEMDYRS